MLALQHVVLLTSVYNKKQMGHSSVAPQALSLHSSPFSRGAMRPSPMNRRIALASHWQSPYNLEDHSRIVNWRNNNTEDRGKSMKKDKTS